MGGTKLEITVNDGEISVEGRTCPLHLHMITKALVEELAEKSGCSPLEVCFVICDELINE